MVRFRPRIPTLFVLFTVFVTANSASAQNTEADRLKAELDALRAEFTQKIAALEDRLKAVEAASPPGAAAVASEPTAVEPPPPPSAPVASSKVFNPDMAAIGDFIGAMGKSPGGGEPSLQMHETELSFQAVVDPYARADVFLTFGPDEVGVEEAFMTFPELPGGFLMKVGKMRDAFGKVNSAHNHVLPFIDRPLMTNNLLGGEDGLADAGISISRLFPNKVAFFEATGQVFRGDSEIFKAEKRADVAYVSHVRAYRDLTESTNLDFGASFAHGHNDVAGATTRIWGGDATFRYTPLRRSIYTHVIARAEVAWSRRSELERAPSAFGGYGYLEYQFGRRWTSGVRLDTARRAEAPDLKDKSASAILTYSPSEFSKVRAQFRHTLLANQVTSNDLLFQFQFLIGAHAAHPF